MRKRIALVCVLALAMGLMASTALANNASGDKSTGGVAYVHPSGGHTIDVSFNAHETPNNLDSDAKGRVNVRNHGSSGDIDFRGTVDCYQSVGEDTAVFGGEIDESDKAAAGFDRFQVRVHDGGTPGRNGDRIAVRRTNNTDCDWTTGGTPVSRGNLKVHH